MENLRKRINFRLVNNAKDYKKYLSKPCFVSQKIFSCFMIKDIYQIMALILWLISTKIQEVNKTVKLIKLMKSSKINEVKPIK